MKMVCPTHGAHFEGEEDVISCRYIWKRIGATKMPKELKLKLIHYVWEWDIDAVYKKYGWIVGVGFNIEKAGKVWDADFESLAPGYSTWPELKRRNFQRRIIKKRLSEIEV